MHDTHTHTSLIITYKYSPYRQYSKQETKQQGQWPPVAPSCWLLPTTGECRELNGYLQALAEYVHALSAHTAQCSYTFTLPTYAHSAQVLVNSVLAHKQLSTRSMWTTTNVDLLSKLYLKCFGCFEALWLCRMCHVPSPSGHSSWQGGTYVATDLLIWLSEWQKLILTNINVATWCVCNMK